MDKKGKEKFDLVTKIGMLLMVEKGIRGEYVMLFINMSRYLKYCNVNYLYG